jgi:tripartite ATP-independent transporter DctP family solute receptor
MTGNQIRIGRRGLLTGAAAVGLGMPLVARAARKISLKYGTNVPVTNPLNVRLQEAFNRIGKETEGAVEIRLFADNQLGSDAAMINQLRSGALEMYSASGVIISTLVPAASITGVGFAWKDESQIFGALDADLGAYVRRELATADLIAMDRCWDVSFKTMTSSTVPIKGPADLSGFKIRVPIGQLSFSLFQAFEAAPTTINFSETYSALQTHIVDGTELPLLTFSSAKLWEVQKYVSITHHMWDGLWQVANAKRWNSIPAELQSVIRKHIDQSALDQRRDTVEQNIAIARDLPSHGVQVVPVDAEPFRAKLRASGYFPEWKDKFGPEAWSLLQKYSEALG